MAKKNKKIPPIVRLKYKKGETIIKEGDFGISIYQVIDGKVEIFTESGDEEIKLATLEPGEVIGEMIFLSGNETQRSASVRAATDALLEAWHPSRISQEYDDMPAIVKQMANQTVKRLQRMTRMISELGIMKTKEKEMDDHDPWAAQRRFYRKETDIECMYRPVNTTKNVKLWGRIKDISKSGMRLDIKKTNSFKYSHEPGDEFISSSFLPTGKRFDVQLKIVNHKEPPSKDKLSLGVIFVNPSEAAEKALGFFLMP